jgi:hypothetical protein
MTNNIKHNRPKYSLEFKQDAAKLVLEKGYSQQQAADHTQHWAINPRSNSSGDFIKTQPKQVSGFC